MLGFAKNEKPDSGEIKAVRKQMTALNRENAELKKELEKYKDKYDIMRQMIEGDEEMMNVEKINYQLILNSKIIKEKNREIDILCARIGNM